MSDLISRQDAIKRFREDGTWLEHQGVTTLTMVEAKQRAVDILESLPSADRPQGEWIKSDILPNGWHCSHCDAPVMTDDISEMLFCPNCGAKMKGADDED